MFVDEVREAMPKNQIDCIKQQILERAKQGHNFLAIDKSEFSIDKDTRKYFEEEGFRVYITYDCLLIMWMEIEL